MKQPIMYPYQLHGHHLKHCDSAKYFDMTKHRTARTAYTARTALLADANGG